MVSSVIKKFALQTYGCQMNVADSELVEGILTNLGLEKTTNYDEADAIAVGLTHIIKEQKSG